MTNLYEEKPDENLIEELRVSIKDALTKLWEKRNDKDYMKHVKETMEEEDIEEGDNEK